MTQNSLLTSFEKNMIDLKVFQKIIVKNGYSYNFHDDFDEIDFLFIDGDHSIDGCKLDYNLYAHKIKKGGYIALHDYYPDRLDLGPTYVINEMVLKSAGISQQAIDAYIPLYKNLMKSIISFDDKQKAIEKSKEITKAWFDKTDKTLVKLTTGINTEADIDQFANAMAQTLSSNWWKYFAAYNPQPTLQKVKCPVLAINGSADIQVPAAANLNGIEKSLKKGGNKHFTTKQFEGLNHLFQKCTKCTVPEYGELETTIEPAVLETIGTWLAGLTSIN